MSQMPASQVAVPATAPLKSRVTDPELRVVETVPRVWRVPSGPARGSPVHFG